MGTRKSDLLLHPTRLRIVMAMSGDELTTAHLRQRLPDVAPATLYRQVGTLHDAGILEVVSERRVRGGVERTYRIVEGSAHVGPEDAKAMTKEQHMTGFVTFVGALVDAMARYLDDSSAEPGSDAMGYRQIPLWLTDDELQAMVGEVGAILERFAANEPGPGRSRTTLSNILIPDAPAMRSGSTSG